MIFNVNLPMAKYNFTLKAKEELQLPPYKGSTLRGGFGITFRSVCCVNKDIKLCKDCGLREKCTYAYVFETSPYRDAVKLRNLAEIPRPFVIEPPVETKTIYRKDEMLNFGLMLIGRAIDYLPFFIFTFKELGDIGIGKKRAEFELLQVDNAYQETIYQSQDGTLRNFDSQIELDRSFNSLLPSTDSLSISFITPTRIKFKNDLVVKPEFHIFIRALLHRISALAYFHCEEELDVDYNLLISRAERIKIKKVNLRWLDWERYSSRQNTRMKMGGFVGEITYAGNLSEFLPLIFLGQYTHVGKNCTFGLGKYEVKEEN